MHIRKRLVARCYLLFVVENICGALVVAILARPHGVLKPDGGILSLGCG